MTRTEVHGYRQVVAPRLYNRHWIRIDVASDPEAMHEFVTKVLHRFTTVLNEGGIYVYRRGDTFITTHGGKEFRDIFLIQGLTDGGWRSIVC